MRQRRQPGIWAVAGNVLGCPVLGRAVLGWAVLGCAVTACSSGPPPVPSATSSQVGQFRGSDAPALLVECMLSQGTLGRSDTVLAGPPSWLRNGSVVITAGTEAKFGAWFRANSGISVAGMTLTEWARWAAANDKLPAEVCGSPTSASALQRRVFGKDPAAGNPWGT